MISEVTPDDWIAFDDAYATFTTRFPMLGLASSRWGALHTRRKHGLALVEAGVARKSCSGRWIAHRERLGVVLFDLLTSGPDRMLRAARGSKDAVT